MSDKSLKLEILQKVSELATAGFGLVAALAWNDAIQSIFKELFGQQSGIWAKIIYAVLVTIIVVLVTMKIGNVINVLKQTKEDDQSKN